MTQLTVTISLDNDEAAEHGGYAVAAYLRELAGKMEDLGTSLDGASGTVRDSSNGGPIGRWAVTEEE